MALLELNLACGEPLEVHRFSIREAVSSGFTVQVLARSPDPCIDLQAIVGQPAALRITHAARLWSGICSQARLVQAVEIGHAEASLSSYELTLVPSLWLLSQRTNHRIFHRLSIPEIAQTLLGEWRIEGLRRIQEAGHPRLAFRVQYGETDLDFLSRLLEEAGIAATFSDEDGEHSRLVLSDALQESAPRRAAPLVHVESPTGRSPGEYATRVSVALEIRPDAVTIRDHDFQRPGWALRGHARRRGAGGALERYWYRPGAFLVDGATAAGAGHDDRHGATLAARVLESERTGRCVVTFESNAIDLRPGTILTIAGHPHPELDPRGPGLLLTSICVDGTPNGEWTVRASAMPAGEPYRPPRRTPKPAVDGVQCATVVGPAGQEIHTDEHGRVRVRFPWDREGAPDEPSSCWVRVAQGWAGAGLGLFVVPRVGQEVLVAFEVGDPDRPIVVGRVSNALNPPPLRLPEEGTQSVWRSASSPGGEGFSEIRIEDRRGAELLSVRAERDMGSTVLGDRVDVVGGDLTARHEGRLVQYTGGDAHLTVAGERRERVGGMQSLTVEGDRHERVAGCVALAAGGAVHVTAGGALVIEGGDVTLRGPGGFIRIDGGGVSIHGAVVNLQSGGAPGEGPAAAPAQPLVPQRVDTRTPGPRRLPLMGFPGLPPLQVPVPPGGGGPLSPEEAVLCRNICLCDADPSPHLRKQDCLTARMWALDDASGNTSKILAEVPYDMSTDPPSPIMSRTNPKRPTRRRPKGSLIPDNVIRKDPTKPPTQDNIEKVIEVKFPPDPLRKHQPQQYKTIAGGAPFEVFTPQRCNCPEREQEQQQQQVTAPDLAEAALLTLMVAVMILNDALPGGQIDDAAIPPVIARILSRLAPLLRSAPMAP